MKLFKDGTVNFAETSIGDLRFVDGHGARTVGVTVNGTLLRGVYIVDDMNDVNGCVSVTPKVARRLARLLLKAADVAEAEEKTLRRIRRHVRREKAAAVKAKKS